MVKVLFINSGIHEKNKIGLFMVLKFLEQQQKVEYKYGTTADIPNYDVIYNPSECINTSNYPNKKFIFGPHFSVFPNNQQMQSLEAKTHKNSIYIQPSEWASRVWRDMGAEQFLPIKSYAFAVDTNQFKPDHTSVIRTEVFIYYKQRHQNELNYVKTFLDRKNITYKIFNYTSKYRESDYMYTLKKSKYGIWLGRHESQGFALQEALSCDVPLLVWDAQTMNQELNSRYNPVPCTTIPYWDERCGEYFHHPNDFEKTFDRLQNKLQQNQYSPREYILENLSTEKCAEKFMELINF